jgi:hypothetical protein
VNETIIKLGRDETTWGGLSLSSGHGGRTAVAMSPGSDPASPSMASKGDPGLPNEDAAFAIDQGDRTMIGVADAHHGVSASHDLIEAIAARPIPGSFEELERGLATLEPTGRAGESSSTLVVAVLDRAIGQGFGISFGDSTLARVGASGTFIVNVRRATYVHLRQPGGLDPSFAHGFHFFVQPGELLAAFTDGINECHYRSPDTSVGLAEIRNTYDQTGPRPEPFARALCRLALDGVSGHPGGQDNIALVVTATDPEFTP